MVGGTKHMMGAPTQRDQDIVRLLGGHEQFMLFLLARYLTIWGHSY